MIIKSTIKQIFVSGGARLLSSRLRQNAASYFALTLSSLADGVVARGIRRIYFSGRAGRLQIFPEMLAKIDLANFGPKDSVAIIATPSCRAAVEIFLAPRDYHLTPATVERFRSGEIMVRIGETVRGKTVVIMQDFPRTENMSDVLMQTLILIDAACRADAEKIVLVCPQLPFIEPGSSGKDPEVDFFHLVLTLLFRAANLNELHLGNAIIRGRANFGLTAMRLVSFELAPFLRTTLEGLNYERSRRSEPLAFLFGQAAQGQQREVLTALAEKAVRGRVARSTEENILGNRVFVFQACETLHTNRDLFEALKLVYAARKKGAKKVTLVMPFLPYGRQERKATSREPITARLLADMIEAAGATEVVSFDMHAPATQGFFTIPMQHLSLRSLIAQDLKNQIWNEGPWELNAENLVFGAPDMGRAKEARNIGKLVLGKEPAMVIVEKVRPEPGKSAISAILGEVEGKDVILRDDMIDSGGSIIKAAQELKKRRANRVFVLTSHPIFSDVELDRIKDLEEYDNIRAYLTRKGKNVNDYVREEGDKFTVNALIRLQASGSIAGLAFCDTINVPCQNILETGERVRVAKSAPFRPPVPIDSGHPFRSIPATCSVLIPAAF